MRELRGVDELREASADDPLVVHLIPHVAASAPLLAAGRAVMFAYDYWDGVGWQLVGPPEDAAELLAAATGKLGPTRFASLPEAAVPLLPEGSFTPGEAWRFRWTDSRPDIAGDNGAWLGPETETEVDRFLDLAFPDASVRPRNRHARRWAGIRNGEGQLVACAADSTESEVGFMASVTTHPDARRTGLALAMTRWLTHALLDEFSRVALWQYSTNTAATALYNRLGYRDEHQFLGGHITVG
jgi:ribosomal protein S18 acetylase RimI-like enzyme